MTAEEGDIGRKGVEGEVVEESGWARASQLEVYRLKGLDLDSKDN